jgi:hypothetical protein
MVAVFFLVGTTDPHVYRNASDAVVVGSDRGLRVPPGLRLRVPTAACAF